jgi:hypothetical protein
MFPGHSCLALAEPGEIFAVPEISLKIYECSVSRVWITEKGNLERHADLNIRVVGIIVPQANLKV